MVKSKWLGRLIFCLGTSKLRIALEVFFRRAFLLAARSTIDQLNSSKQVSSASACIDFDADTLAQLKDYYKEADANFTALTSHVPTWQKLKG